MQTRIVFSILVCFIFKLISAQTSTYLGSVEPDILNGNYKYYSLNQVLGCNDEILISGGFSGIIRLGNDSLISGNIRSGFFGVQDSLGVWKWAKKIEGIGYNQINTSIAIEDGWLIMGVFKDTIFLGENELIADGNQNIFIIKVSTDGMYEWAKQLNISPMGGNQFLSYANEDKFYFATEFVGEYYWNDSVFNAYNRQMVLMGLLSAEGDIEQVHMINSNAPVYLQAMETSSNGGLLIAGIVNDSTNISGHTIYTNNYENIFITLLDSNFQPLWINTSDGIGRKRVSDAHVVDDGVILTGHYSGLFSMVNEDFPLEYGTHIFTTKINNEGELVWKHAITGNSHKQSASVVEGNNGNIYLLGNFRGEIEFSDEVFQTEEYTYNWFIARYSENGQPNWISFIDNNVDIQANLIKGFKQGHLSLYGLSVFDVQSVLNHNIDTLSQGNFMFDVLDCEFGLKPKLPSDTVFCKSVMLDAGLGYESYIWNEANTGQFFEVFNTGIVHLEVKDIYGCVYMDSVFVEVLPEFEVAISGVDMICPNNGSTMLWVDTDAEVIWSTGETVSVIFAIETGEYSVEAINYAGCIADDSTIITTFETTPPEVGDYYMLGLDQEIQIFPGDYSTYLWTGNINDAILNIDGSLFEEGIYNYLLEVVDYNGCYQTHEFIVEIIDATTSSVFADGLLGDDIDEILNFKLYDFIIYPNPAKGLFHLMPISNELIEIIESKHSKIEIAIWNMHGEIMLKQNITEEKHPWEFNKYNKLSPGSYMISLMINDKILTIKPIIILQ
jgi:hypothetical protein